MSMNQNADDRADCSTSSSSSSELSFADGYDPPPVEVTCRSGGRDARDTAGGTLLSSSESRMATDYDAVFKVMSDVKKHQRTLLKGMSSKMEQFGKIYSANEKLQKIIAVAQAQMNQNQIEMDEIKDHQGNEAAVKKPSSKS